MPLYRATLLNFVHRVKCVAKVIKSFQLNSLSSCNGQIGMPMSSTDVCEDSDVASTRAKQPRIAGTDVGYPDVMRVTSPTSVLDQYRWPKRPGIFS